MSEQRDPEFKSHAKIALVVGEIHTLHDFLKWSEFFKPDSIVWCLFDGIKNVSQLCVVNFKRPIADLVSFRVFYDWNADSN